MTRSGTDRLKYAPPLGTLPVLQYALPSQLQIDPEYQRSIDNGPSQALIRKIATYWNWALCLPLVVSRRADGGMYVIDGQHRLEAAKLRRDIAQLPCVIVDMADRGDEAAAFVHLNQQRRPLGKLDIFKAAVSSGDTQASAIAAALREAGLSVAPHLTANAWKPGMVGNIAGIEAAWKLYGPYRTRAALVVMARAFEGQIIRLGGTIFPGIVGLTAQLTVKRDPLIWMHKEEADMVAEMIGETSQDEWRAAIARERADNPALRPAAAATKVVADAWRELVAALAGEDEDEGEREAFAKAGAGA